MTAADRAAAIEAGLTQTRQRIATAARAAGREPADVTLIAVTKTHPIADVQTLVRLGVTDLGENRVNELADKADALDESVRWHFVGQLQTNKVNRLVRVPGLVCVHSVDRPRLVEALARGVRTHRPDRPLDCLVQVDLDAADGPAGPAASGRGGVAPGEVPAVAAAIADSDGLVLRGVMAVAPLDTDPADAFTRLRELSRHVQAAHPGADAMSAGMSGDLEQAVAAGATHVRVGTAILQSRGSLR